MGEVALPFSNRESIFLLEMEIQKQNEEFEQKAHEHTAQMELQIQRLKESEEKYNQLFNSIDEGFCIIEMIFDARQKPIDYRFLSINDSFVRQTGLPDAVGKRMREFAPDHEEHWFEIYGKIALTGEPIRFENRAEQLHRWYDVYAFRYGEPKNMQVAILFNDITERKKAEQQLELANKELESFTYSVSHDLRSPIRSLIGYSKILAEDFNEKLGEDGTRILSIIHQSALRMNNLIDDLLKFSKLGKTEMQKSDIDTEKLVQSVLDEMGGSFQHKANVKVNRLPPIYADRPLLTQVWINLIGNALKYSAKKEDPEIEIGAYRENDEIIYFVKDNGAGFDMQYGDKLFGVFQRLHRAEEFEGTGVGLSIVKRIIAKHAGRVWAEGKVNEGATFYFSLPR
jgi:PAS domain S-box-containing protein